MSDFKKWEDLEKELNFTPEEDLELQLEMNKFSEITQSDIIFKGKKLKKS